MSSEPPSASGGNLPNPRDRNLPSDRRALAAGLVALLHQGDAVLADGLHRKRLAGISGQSRQTYYQYFRDHTDYLTEVLRLILDPTDDAWPTIDLVEYVRGVIATSPTDSLQIVHQLAETDFENLLSDEHWQLVIAVWALARERPEIARGLAETWTFYNRRTAAAIQELLDQWDSALVPPFDTTRAAHVFGALGEGLAMRAMVMDDVGADLFADTIAAIAHAIVVPLGEDQEFEPTLPLAIDPFDGPLDPVTVERVVGLALDHHTTVGRPPTISQLARAAGVTEASVRSHFGDTDGSSSPRGTGWPSTSTGRRTTGVDPRTRSSGCAPISAVSRTWARPVPISRPRSSPSWPDLRRPAAHPVSAPWRPRPTRSRTSCARRASATASASRWPPAPSPATSSRRP